MHGKKTILTILAACLVSPALAREFSGARALEFTRKVVLFGPRPPGSPAIRKLRAHILSELKQCHCRVTQDDFTGQTPGGPVPMSNIIARFPGTSGRIVAITGHYDTKLMPGMRFVGADDGGSSAGFLLELAHVLEGAPRKDDVYLVWFDGEEAFGQWSDTDSLYGSRHLAQKWAEDGTLSRIKALINVDMIGDRNLDIMLDENSSAPLRKLVWDTADQLGYGKYFLREPGSTEDDHIPFVQMGVNALDLIDFDYPPWHSPGDTMDKLSAHSFQVVGAVLMAVIEKLEGMP